MKKKKKKTLVKVEDFKIITLRDRIRNEDIRNIRKIQCHKMGQDQKTSMERSYKEDGWWPTCKNRKK